MKRDQYTIIEQLAGFGGTMVACARNEQGETVLLKSLGDPPGETRLESLNLLRNTRCAHLRVPQTVSKDEQGWFSTARWLPGPSLETARQSRFGGRVPVRQALVWLRHCLLALEVLHYHGLLHGDVKPSNLLLDANDQAVLVDLEGVQPFGQSEIDMATPEYLVPEAKSRATVQRDLYAATLTFFALILGRLPGPDESPGRPSRLDPLVPEAIDPLVLKGLGEDDAFETATEMLAVVDRLLGTDSPGPTTASTSPPTRRVSLPETRRQFPVALALVALLTYFLGLGLAWSLKPAPISPAPSLAQRSGIEYQQATLEDRAKTVWETTILGRPVACFVAPDSAYGGESAQDRAAWTAGVLQQAYFQKRTLSFEFREESPTQSEVWLAGDGYEALFVMRITKEESEFFDTPAPALARMWARLVEDTFTLLGFPARPGQAQGILLLRPWQARAEALSSEPGLTEQVRIANLKSAFSSLRPQLQKDILESFRPKKENKRK